MLFDLEDRLDQRIAAVRAGLSADLVDLTGRLTEASVEVERLCAANIRLTRQLADETHRHALICIGYLGAHLKNTE